VRLAPGTPVRRPVGAESAREDVSADEDDLPLAA
jgi:hypothetical protein